ncbi:hypothetical protein ABEV41_00440 [Geobacillus thermodenitrificans]|uniref:hypothetical protein n=1 Tax=Geobacillus thermodenitrificans TaxID=33940 RepID=UPI003D1D04F8
MAVKLIGGDMDGRVWLKGIDYNYKDFELMIYNNRFSIKGYGYKKENMTTEELLNFLDEREELSRDILYTDDIINANNRNDIPELNVFRKQINNLKTMIQTAENELIDLIKKRKEVLVDIYANEIMKIQKEKVN